MGNSENDSILYSIWGTFMVVLLSKNWAFGDRFANSPEQHDHPFDEPGSDPAIPIAVL